MGNVERVPREIRFHYHRPGKDDGIFSQWLVEDGPDLKVMLLERHDGPTLHIAGAPALDRGAPAIWFVVPGAWFDIGTGELWTLDEASGAWSNAAGA